MAGGWGPGPNSLEPTCLTEGAFYRHPPIHPPTPARPPTLTPNTLHSKIFKHSKIAPPQYAAISKISKISKI